MCDPYNDIVQENRGLWNSIFNLRLIPSFWFDSESESRVRSALEPESDESLCRVLALVYLFQKRYLSLGDKLFGINKELEAKLAKNWADLLEKKVIEELERRGIEREYFDPIVREIMRKLESF